MKSSKSFEDFSNARKRGANINMIILEMRANNFDNEKIQRIIDTEHPSQDNYFVDMKGLVGNAKTREINYRELYEDCKTRLAMLESSIGKNEPRRILKATKRSREDMVVEPVMSTPNILGELQERLNKRKKSSSTKRKKSIRKKRSVVKKSKSRKSVVRRKSKRRN